MGSELEEVSELAQELVAEELDGKSKKQKVDWAEWVALSTMVMALLSALGALLAAFTANEMLIDRTKEILEVSDLNTDRIDMQLLRSKHDILGSLGTPLDPSEVDRLRHYEMGLIEAKEEEISAEETDFQAASVEHELFAVGVTLLSIAITLSGMAVVSRRRTVWLAGLAIGIAGAGFFCRGVYLMLLS